MAFTNSSNQVDVHPAHHNTVDGRLDSHHGRLSALEKDMKDEQERKLKGGAKGEKGDKGEQGRPGPEGARGADGKRGASAYEVAVAAGFSGSRDEWLESLKNGPRGPAGKDGKEGRDGVGRIVKGRVLSYNTGEKTAKVRELTEDGDRWDDCVNATGQMLREGDRVFLMFEQRGDESPVVVAFIERAPDPAVGKVFGPFQSADDFPVDLGSGTGLNLSFPPVGRVVRDRWGVLGMGTDLYVDRSITPKYWKQSTGENGQWNLPPALGVCRGVELVERGLYALLQNGALFTLLRLNRASREWHIVASVAVTGGELAGGLVPRRDGSIAFATVSGSSVSLWKLSSTGDGVVETVFAANGGDPTRALVTVAGQYGYLWWRSTYGGMGGPGWWRLDVDANELKNFGRASTAGMPDTSSGTRSFATAPDGSLVWINRSGQVGRATSAGAVTESQVIPYRTVPPTAGAATSTEVVAVTPLGKVLVCGGGQTGDTGSDGRPSNVATVWEVDGVHSTVAATFGVATPVYEYTQVYLTADSGEERVYAAAWEYGSGWWLHDVTVG